MRKWTLQEDYIVCKFCKEYECMIIKDQLLDGLMSKLAVEGFDSRSRDAVQKRAYAYLLLLGGQDANYIPKQSRELYRVFASKEYNLCHREEINSYIASKQRGAFTNGAFDISLKSTNSLTNMVHIANGRSFIDVLEDYIQESCIKPKSNIYRDVGMKQDTYSSIRRGKYSTVSRENVFRLCFGLRLNYDNAVKLMKSCGVTLRDNEVLDTVVEYHLKRGPSKRDGEAYKYDCELIDVDLLDSGVNTLFSEW